jgi:Uncharacterized conserved protein
MIFWVAVCVAIALLLYVGVTFNEFVAERNQVRAAWADIDVQLQRRHDLVPQLAATVKGYAEHERSTLSAVTELRTRAQAGGTIAQRAQIETELAAQVTQLLALQERYPDLKASGNFCSCSATSSTSRIICNTRGASTTARCASSTRTSSTSPNCCWPGRSVFARRISSRPRTARR